MQKARRHLERLRPLVGNWFQVLFHSLVQGTFHLSFTVLVHYRSLDIFSLTGWFRQIHTEFHMFRATQDTPRSISIYIQDYHLYGRTFQIVLYTVISQFRVLQPQFCLNKIGLGYFHFARRYFGNHYCFLFLRVLRCFSSPGMHPQADNYSSSSWVTPFGNLHLTDHLRLSVAYRSLSRPSSLSRAKASPSYP